MKTLLAIILMTLCIPLLADQTDFVKNGDFSNGFSSWQKSTWPNLKFGQVSVENGALKIINTNLKQRSLLEQIVPLKPSTKYKISFRIKCDMVVTDGKISDGARILILRSGNNMFDCSGNGPWTGCGGNFNWKKCEYIFSTPKESGRYVLYLQMMRGTGTVWFDDIHITENSKSDSEKLRLSLYPAKFQNGTIHLAAGFPMALYGEFFATPSDAENLKLEAELPEGIRLIGASPWWFNRAGTYKPEKITSRQILSGKEKYIRHIISIDSFLVSKLKKDKLAWNNLERIYLVASEHTHGGKARFRLFSPKGTKSTTTTLSIKVLPPLPKMTPPQKFQMGIHYLFDLNAPFPEVRQSSLDLLFGLSRRPMTYRILHWDWLPEHLREDLTKRCDIGIMMGSFGEKKWREKNNFPNYKADYGKGPDHRFCPTYLAKNPDSPYWHDFWVKAIKKESRNISDLKWIEWDIEPMNVCRCILCREHFSKELKLPKTVTISETQGKYAREYFNYRVKQNNGMIRNFAKMVRKHFPRQKVGLVTDPLHAAPPHIKEWCGVDVREIDQSYDIMRNMFYYSGINYYDDFLFNHQKLKTAQYPLIDPSENIEMFYNRYTPKSVYMNIVATAALGGTGIGIYPSENLDGEYIHALINASNAVAKAEKYYESPWDTFQALPRNVKTVEAMNGDRKITAVIPDLISPQRGLIHKLPGQGKLITIFNYSPDNDMILEIPPQGKFTAVRDLISGMIYSDVDGTQPFLTEIAPLSIKFLEFCSQPAPAGPRFDIKNLKTKLNKFLSDSHNTLPNSRSGQFYAGWGVLESGGAAAELSDGNRTVQFDASQNGKVVSFRIKGREMLFQKQDPGFADEWLIEGINEILKYTVTSYKASDTQATLSMETTLPPPRNAAPDGISLAGIKLKKNVSLTNGQLQCLGELINTTSQVHSIRLRIRNYPRLPMPWKIISDNTIYQDTNPTLIALRKNAVNPFGGKILNAKYQNTPFVINSSKGNLTINAPEASGVMVWYNTSGPSTVEPFFGPIILKPGEKFKFRHSLY